MVALSEKHPEIVAEFHAVIHKTSNKFSAMAIDQCHEQNNATVKELGGAIGLITDPLALRRWMVAGPEVARIVVEFEKYAMKAQDDGNSCIMNSILVCSMYFRRCKVSNSSV